MRFAQLTIYVATAVGVAEGFAPGRQALLGRPPASDKSHKATGKQPIGDPSNLDETLGHAIDLGLEELEMERMTRGHGGFSLKRFAEEGEIDERIIDHHGSSRAGDEEGPSGLKWATNPVRQLSEFPIPTRPDRPHFPFPAPGNPPGQPGGKRPSPEEPGEPGNPGKPGKPGKRPHHPPPGHRPDPGHPHHFNLTLYEILEKSNHTSKFFELVQKDEKLVELLKDTSKNHTILVPINRAFGSPPHWPHKPPHFAANQTGDIATYHVLPGSHSGAILRGVRTLQSILEDENLGKGQKQRLRFSTYFPSPHVHVNIVSTVIASDFYGTNGVIHAVSHILLPPPKALHLLSLFPNQFSTTLYAISKLGLEDEINGLAGKSLTFFPPTNKAWRRLPWDVTTFLFSKHGVNVLKALIRYHIIPNHAVYSDVIQSGDQSSNKPHPEDFHAELPTLLEGKKLGIDIKRWGRHFTIFRWRINGFKKVDLQDVLVEDGVVQIPSGVLIPPCEKKAVDEGKGGCAKENEEIAVEELIERLKVEKKE